MTLERAIQRYELAVEKDPLFARAWASLAEGYDYAQAYVGRDWNEDARRAESAARRAIALDDQLAAGHAMLALTLFSVRWDFAAAEKEYRRTIELDPRSVYAIVEYADLLRDTGRAEQAATEVRKARALLPMVPVLAVKEAEIQLDQKQPDAAIQTANSALRMNRDYLRAHVVLGMAWEAKGDFEQALSEYRTVLNVSPHDRRALPALGYLLGKLGRRTEALSIATKLEDLTGRLRNMSYQLGVVYAGLGDSERALYWLERAHQTRQALVPFIAVDYRLRGLRDSPRFRSILDRLGLKPV
jgi:tetratricopeptide (TPR) repeat protein